MKKAGLASVPDVTDMKILSSMIIASFGFAALGPGAAFAQTPVPVTVENSKRPESDMYFRSTIELAGGVGKFGHRRDVEAIDKQMVIRANRDTLYSAGCLRSGCRARDHHAPRPMAPVQ